MSEEQNPYSTREIDTFMETIHEKLDLIIVQTTKTNGRVTKLEDSFVDIKVWRGFITGGIAIISAILLPVVFIVISNLMK